MAGDYNINTQQPCRTCGTCPTCGNRPTPSITQPWQYGPDWTYRPQPYVYPQITWGRITTDDQTTYTGDISVASGRLTIHNGTNLS